MAHVVILGGGFGGLAAAHDLRTALRDDDRITLIDRGDRFFMGFAKLWDLAGVRPLAEGTVPLARLADHGVDFVRADITGIDPGARRVDTTAGPFTADALLVALGAGPSPAHAALLRGAGAYDLYDAASLPGMHRDLEAVEGGRVLVAILGGPVKCPPAPYEAALIVDERLRRRGVRERVEVAVATPQPMSLPVAGPDASRYVAERLAERDIALLTERVVSSLDGERGVATCKDGSELDYRVLLGVPACAPPAVLRDSPLVAASGWIEADPASLATAFERVYAVGDCTLVPSPGGQLPKAGVFAAAEARVAAANLAVDLGRGGDRARFDGYGFCFLELPGREVAFVEGHFLSSPSDVRLTDPSAERFAEKQAYEQERLAAWLG